MYVYVADAAGEYCAVSGTVKSDDGTWVTMTYAPSDANLEKFQGMQITAMRFTAGSEANQFAVGQITYTKADTQQAESAS